MTSTGNPRTRDRLRSLQIPTTHLSQPLPADPRPTLTGSSSGPIARAATSAWMVGGSGTSSNPASTASRRFNAASADARRASSTSARAEQSSMNSRGVCPTSRRACTNGIPCSVASRHASASTARSCDSAHRARCSPSARSAPARTRRHSARYEPATTGRSSAGGELVPLSRGARPHRCDRSATW
jgi:hypothetical protein